jgi:hypothetical protein
MTPISILMKAMKASNQVFPVGELLKNVVIWDDFYD